MRLRPRRRSTHYSTHRVAPVSRPTTAAKKKPDNRHRVHADAVVVAVPLGVLKDNAITFRPQLPLPKREAIECLGFGLINKVVLVYERVFWPTHLPFFGRCQRDGELPGDTYMYYNMALVMHRPVLIAICTGAAAERLETLPAAEIKRRAVDRLQQIIPEAKDHKPLDVVASSWRSDPYSRGAYSFVSTKTEAPVYQVLAQPVTHKRGDPPGLFFAGEHTCLNYPATVHGAMLSGHRVAQEVKAALDMHDAKWGGRGRGRRRRRRRRRRYK